jgi:hypothetical protein
LPTVYESYGAIAHLNMLASSRAKWFVNDLCKQLNTKANP